MLFTWDTDNLCIIFRWWHIQGPISLVFSLLGVVAVTALYEALRAASRRYEVFVAKQTEEVPRKYRVPDPKIYTLFLLFMKVNGLELRDIFMELLLRERLSFGQDETRLKLIKGRMLSRRSYMHYKTFMLLC
jgi:hypothetical protein